MIKVSVIIPIYNAEKYIAECLESLINQTLKEIEIICVDDGSKDKSVSIIEEYKSRDNRIIYIKQNNQYAGVARNNGLKKANGKYIIFLDADDFFAKDMLATLFLVAQKRSTDIVVFGNYNYSETNKKITKVDFPKSWMLHFGVTNASKLGVHVFSATRGVPWNKFFLKEFIINNSIEFQGLKHNNDEFFSKLAVLEAERIFFLRKRFVYYRIDNPHSLQGMAFKDLYCVGEVYKSVYETLIRRNELTPVVEKALGVAFEGNVIYYFNKSKKSEDAKQFYNYLRDSVFPYIHVDLSNYHILKSVSETPNYDEFILQLFKHYYAKS